MMTSDSAWPRCSEVQRRVSSNSLAVLDGLVFLIIEQLLLNRWTLLVCVILRSFKRHWSHVRDRF